MWGKDTNGTATNGQSYSLSSVSRQSMRRLLAVFMLSTSGAEPRSDKAERTDRLSAARAKLAEALTAVWSLEDELHLTSWDTIRRLKPRPTRKGQKSLARTQDDSLMSLLQRAQLGGKGATCLDWGMWATYGSDFKNCAVVYEFEFSAKRRLFDSSGHKIVGDLKDLSFVPAGLFDLIICSAVFEHVPQFWRAARSLSHLAKPGATLVFGVPFWYPTHFNPGDFWRFTFQGASYLLESNGFAICHAFADGERSAQLGALGLTHGEVPVSLLHRGSINGSNTAGLLYSTQYSMVAVKGSQRACSAVPEISGDMMMSRISKDTMLSFHRKGSKAYWPQDAAEYAVADAPASAEPKSSGRCWCLPGC